ncbi:hypothetical protein [Chryseobacterium rhizosphaerae]|uniref:hypothetical protein n=1 Tax=Chryseobacterium rhizosphaerae TaxID=395937 RepID=UPI00235866CF|nr:hypothetical protein [Chryseobacterium rhizosphaerae]MDC8102663.1 hypothetical protein [Chryseobacterium rhizosphaerae]
MDQKKIIAAIILIAGFLTSIYVGINISSKNNIVLYDFVINKRFSIIDIALGTSEETVFKSQLISILLYLFFIILVLRLRNNGYLKHIFCGVILLNIIFEIYCIYLVFGDTYSGQHLRLNTVMFVLGLFLLKENKNS